MPVRRIVFELSFQASGPREFLRSGTDLQFKCFVQMPAAAVPRDWNPSVCANAGPPKLDSNFPFIRQLMSVDISLGAVPMQFAACVSIGTPFSENLDHFNFIAAAAKFASETKIRHGYSGWWQFLEICTRARPAQFQSTFFGVPVQFR